MTKAYSRRFIIRSGVIALGASAMPAALPLAQAAESGEKVDETDQLAQELGYRHDAVQAANRSDAGQLCQGCAFFQGEVGAEWGGCIVFGGRQVKAAGWCQSFRPKTG